MPVISNTSPTELEQQLREMNQALVISSVRQHELTEQAEQKEALARESESRLSAELAATQALQEISTQMIQEGDVASLYGKILDASVAIMRSDMASLQILDEGQDALRMLAFRGFDPEFGKGFELNLSDTRTSFSVARRVGRRVIVPDVKTCDFIVGTSALEDHLKMGIRAVQSTPLVSRSGRLLGMISTHWHTPHTPAESDLRRFDILARQVADLIERTQAEDALRQSEQLRRFVMDSMPQKIFTAKPNGDVDYINPQWTQFTGLSFEQIRDWGWTQFIHPDDLAENTRVWHHSIDTGEPFRFEHRWRRADGEYRWHVSQALAMRDEAGQVVMWIGCNTDVHDMKQAQEALRASEVRYRRLVESARDGILILDADTGKITDANVRMGELMETESHELWGKELWEIGLASDKLASKAAVQALRRNGDIHYENLPLETTRGHRVEVEVVANVYTEEHHSAIQCNIRDISERMRLERQTQDQAKELSNLHQRKDEFLAMLSHELRNPLAAISAAVQMLGLERENENLMQHRARGIIERQMGHVEHLVDDLLEVSRITTGRIQLRQERIAVSGIVEGAIETVRPLLQQRGHDLTVSLPTEPILLNADAARLEQVLVNLLTNAAKYTDEGGAVWLTVQQEGDECVLRVRDTGVGIAPDLLPYIFDLFTQAERSLHRSQGGLGIGLALVRRLTQLHGGNVEVYSELGKGSEFVVRLPVLAMDAPKQLSPATETVQPAARSLRVLMVEDDADTAFSFSMMLKHSGHDARVVQDGLAALDAALEYQPDVVLLDIGLPGLNGYEVATRIRQQPALQSIVLVALTGYGQEADMKTSLQAGFNYHLVKPVSFKNVQQILQVISEQQK